MFVLRRTGGRHRVGVEAREHRVGALARHHDLGRGQKLAGRRVVDVGPESGTPRTVEPSERATSIKV